jgi:cytoskeleton protein RodZ
MGSQLARRRQELGWSVEQVAGRLNLAPRQIDALESDNLSALPGLASTRGFVRAYAKLLRIDAAPLVATLTKEAGPQEEVIPLRRPISSTPFAPAKLAPMKRGGSGSWLWGVLALAIFVLAVAGAWRAGLFESALDGLVHGRESAPLAEPATASVPSAPAVAAMAPAGASTADNQPAIAAGDASAPAVNASTPAAAASPAPAPTPVPAARDSRAGLALAATAQIAPTSGAAAEAIKPAPARALVIKAQQTCWIEIRRGDKSVATRTLQPGAVETIDVGAGATVVLGNASGVEVSLDGKPLDVRTKARNNVTRLELKST